MAGKVNNVGLIEVPMGTTLREVIFEIGGGIKNGKKFKAVQTGGPSGGCLTEKHLDTPIDYDNLLASGSMMGSGGMIVMDEDDCMVSVAKFYLEFTVDESCGKCTPCRIGNKRLLEILDRITRGLGRDEDLDELQNLARVIRDSSLCALGRQPPIQCFRPWKLLGRIRGPRAGPPLYGAPLPRPDEFRDRPQGLQRLFPLRSHVSAGSHQRHPQTTLRHRPGPLHQVRHLPRKMQVRRNQHPLTTPPRQIRMETIKLTIDNRTAEVAPGTNLVEAAASVGIKIPTLCYLNLHELGCKNDPGVCRICVVEVEGRKTWLRPAKPSARKGWSSAPTHPASSTPGKPFWS